MKNGETRLWLEGQRLTSLFFLEVRLNLLRRNVQRDDESGTRNWLELRRDVAARGKQSKQESDG